MVVEPTTPKRRIPLGSLGRKSWGNLRSKLSPGRSQKSDAAAAQSQFVVLSSHLDLYERLAQQTSEPPRIQLPADKVFELDVTSLPDITSLGIASSSQEPASASDGPALLGLPPLPADTTPQHHEPSLKDEKETTTVDKGSASSDTPAMLEPSLLPAMPLKHIEPDDEKSDVESDNTSAFSFDKPIRQRSTLYYKPAEPEPREFSGSDVASFAGSDLYDEDNIWDDEEDLSHLDPDFSPHDDFANNSLYDNRSPYYSQAGYDDILAEVNRVSSEESIHGSPVELRRANTDFSLVRRSSQTIRRGDTVVTLFERSNSVPTRTVSVRSSITPIKE